MDYLLPLAILAAVLLLALLFWRQKPSSPGDASDQLRIVMRSRFENG